FTDTIKHNTATTIAHLRRMGLEIGLVTGDNPRSAGAVAAAAGIDIVYAGLSPEEKAEHVSSMQAAGKRVALVGDGINDAPALARSDIGIAIGGGTDIAVESGDIVLIRNDPAAVAAALQLSAKVMRRIKQNLFWAFAYNTALIPLAAGVLFPISGITFRPELAGLAMAMSSVTIVSLSLLLRRYTPPAAQILDHHPGT
ncbi:HAD-IC family P-type ATPase, partial [bacterium]|nr:HAD-IC family P-type ATPase [candidate division CSSED10-310 bacterium]